MAHENVGNAVLSIRYPKLRTQNFLYSMYNFAYGSDIEKEKIMINFVEHRQRIFCC
jgi:hypothetical protein